MVPIRVLALVIRELFRDELKLVFKFCGFIMESVAIREIVLDSFSINVLLLLLLLVLFEAFKRLLFKEK